MFMLLSSTQVNGDQGLSSYKLNIKKGINQPIKTIFKYLKKQYLKSSEAKG